ncbi:MAG TPA: GIY-YIG nuclease family protein [Methanomassiliicoccaceae archaeon]|jgi:Uri superfamily endonuclease|nr:GIY-YIG nuclease family protein [Methanomassiliicoccaceae archaeon]HPP44240.1 GIY-YIG nuclease family protein [Methanomassiliicoccaceae archaeon]
MPRGEDVKGAYILLMVLDEPRDITVGSLGLLHLSKGTYAYVGSAMGGLEQRVARHLRKEKRIHWHIDHLLSTLDDAEALLIPSMVNVECELASFISSVPGASPVLGFGCSDCRCRSHLFLLPGPMAECLRSSFPPEMTRRPHVRDGKK